MSDWRASTPATQQTPTDALRQQVAGPKTTLVIKGGLDPVRIMVPDPMRIEYLIHNQSNYNIAIGTTSQIKEAALGKGGFILFAQWAYRSRDQDEVWVYCTQDATIALSSEVRMP